MKRLLAVLIMLACAVSVTAQKKGFEQSLELGYKIESVGAANKYDYEPINSYSVMFFNGYRFNEMLFLGVGVGIDYSVWKMGSNAALYASEYWYVYPKPYRNEASHNRGVFIPVVGRVKFNPGNTKVTPYLRCDFGYNIATQKQRHIPKSDALMDGGYYVSTYATKYQNRGKGFMFNPAVGLDFKLDNTHTLYFDAGYSLIAGGENDVHSFAVKVGIEF